MNQLKKTLIEKAERKHSKIFPCGLNSSLNECFTVEEDQLLFWYNTEDNSTHLLSANL